MKDVNYKFKTHCIPVILLEYSKKTIFTIGSNCQLQTLRRTQQQNNVKLVKRLMQGKTMFQMFQKFPYSMSLMWADIT